MSHLLKNRYFSLIAEYLIAVTGILLLDWDAANMLFFMFFYHLLKVPVYIILHHKLNGRVNKETMAFTLVFSFIFLGYFIFYLILIYMMTPKSMFYDPTIFEILSDNMGELLQYFGLPLIGLIIVEFVSFMNRYKNVETNRDKSDNLLRRLIIYYGASVPVLIMAGVTKSNEFDLDKMTAALIALSMLFLLDLYFLGKQKILDFGH